ncbi:MAG: PEGA domain-containing protein, partial [Calditrichae bacterium]|nr:PEGA domain-containing protein [Calditrichia bacterium]NIV72817.1 PEGA domain-containing protein [Calditrichia bacterium]NIW79667.1 PEGA domain-containing protein [Calditrichia bacterium]
GNYFISVYKEGYASWPPMRRINVEAGKTAVASFTLKNTAKMGKVQIETNLPDYQLFVDGIPFAKTASQIEVPIGYRVITAIKDGYLTRPNHHRILINDDQVVRLQFQFERQKDIGYLQVSSNRSSAYIYLDDHLTGIKANSAVIPIKEGIYKVRLRENGFQSSPSEELFQVHPGEKHELLFNLQPESDQDTIQLITRKPGASI